MVHINEIIDSKLNALTNKITQIEIDIIPKSLDDIESKLLGRLYNE